MTGKLQCSRCEVRACTVGPEGKRNPGEAPPWCPMKTKTDVIQKALKKYTKEDRKIAHAAALVESEAYLREPWGLKPYATRVLEIINFAKKMDYKKIGIACCFNSGWDANVMHNALANRGFEVIVRFCKVDQVKNTTFLGLKDEETLVPGGYQSMCNPITQVDTLVDSGCDMIITHGECTGHDALAGKYSQVPFVVLGVKDRVLAHDPVVALTCPWNQYYKKLTREEPLRMVYVKGHYRSY